MDHATAPVCIIKHLNQLLPLDDIIKSDKSNRRKTAKGGAKRNNAAAKKGAKELAPRRASQRQMKKSTGVKNPQQVIANFYPWSS